MNEFFQLVIETIIRVNMNQSVNQEKVSDIQKDYETLEKARKIIGLACKKQDEDLRTIRQIKGEDYAKSVKLHRQPKSNTKVDPLTEMLQGMVEK